MNLRSLSLRLVTWYAGVLTVVFLVLAALTFALLRHYLEANVLDNQARRARQIAATLIAHASRDAEAAVGAQVENLYSPESNDRFIRITRDDGTIVYASGAPRGERFVPSRVPPLGAAGTASAARKVPVGEDALLIAAVPATAADGTRYRVEVGTSAAPLEATLRRLLALLAVGLPLAVAAAAAGGFVLVRRALEPVERIARKAEEITQHNLSERLPRVHSGDELERLSVSLNHMISRLQEAIEGSKQFIADASHELRTPLAVMRGELEGLAQDRLLGRETRETLGSVLEEVERLAEIVESLFALSRLDAGEAHAEWRPFDLAELAATTAEQMSLLATDKNLSIACDSRPGVLVEGDPARLKQVIVNLLDNAIKYTPAGGRVRLSVRREQGFAVLEVADDGIGIPAEALPHVFKRFFRVDRSRSREQGGAGLGLAIVQSICAAHGAHIEVVSGPGRGSTFRLRQPLAAGTPLPV
ncbi:MAG: HAMP domain-containing protein [Gammaproteobacteria bacterium]|nr:HAMP domain-containing protein [Gammaproteobacteria bacterium]MBV8306745.1 HAMP domain-containing protein [Gammaproteobacteria bacterium]MBV8404666.1 HAMP domain-containing protein [Gammaproteobacteria bacterium]